MNNTKHFTAYKLIFIRPKREQVVYTELHFNKGGYVTKRFEETVKDLLFGLYYTGALLNIMARLIYTFYA